MIHSFDQRTHDALNQLALQPGEERLRAPLDDQDRVQLQFFGPRTKAFFKITVEPDLVHVEREDGEAFGIADHSHDRDNPISALGRAVTGLTVQRGDNGWSVKQHPDRLVHVNNHDSFGLFWRVLVMHVQTSRQQKALNNQQAAS